MTHFTKLFLSLALGSAATLGACKPAADMSGHGAKASAQHMTAAQPENASAATKAYVQANAQMHKDMTISFTNDADRDFMAAMIPHHEGALAMARVALEYGKDPQVRKLAQDIIVGQEKEISQMKAWQNTKTSPAGQ